MQTLLIQVLLIQTLLIQALYILPNILLENYFKGGYEMVSLYLCPINVGFPKYTTHEIKPRNTLMERYTFKLKNSY